MNNRLLTIITLVPLLFAVVLSLITLSSSVASINSEIKNTKVQIRNIDQKINDETNIKVRSIKETIEDNDYPLLEDR